jgi:acyl transferase domain-containing protein
MGHSLGEDVAGCVAGVFALEDALALIAARGRLMQALPDNGEMRVVFAGESTVRELLAAASGDVAIAAVNGPQSVTISGRADALRAVVDACTARGIKSRLVTASHGFHSALMDPVLEPLEAVASRIARSEPRIDFVSNVTGDLVVEGEVTAAGYWSRHVRDTVQFARGVQTLFERGYRLFVEIGPSSTLSALGRQCIPDEAVWLSSLRKGRGDWDALLETLSDLYVRGVAVDWEGFDAGYGRRRADAPLYPFQRKRYWVEMPAVEQAAPVVAVPLPDAVEAAGVPAPPAVENSRVDALRAAYPDERRRLLTEMVAAEVARVLNVDVEELRDPYAGLMDLGLDSLMAVELRTALTERLQMARTLPATLVMDHPSMHAIALFLERTLLEAPAPVAAASSHTAAAASAVETANGAADAVPALSSEQEIEALSEEEVEAMLLRRLEGIQEPV